MPPATIEFTEFSRSLRQKSGAISSTYPKSSDLSLEQLPALKAGEKRYFGIGQGNLRVTPLQVANAMASIARNGIFQSPRLYKEMQYYEGVNLDITRQTLDTVYDGMSAVVNEPQGTANTEFGPLIRTFTQQNVKIYGKTGSTEKPYHAWFAGFAEDSSNKKIAFSIIVEGGQHGSRDAAPLACDIIQFCIESGYIGRAINTTGGI